MVELTPLPLLELLRDLFVEFEPLVKLLAEPDLLLALLDLLAELETFELLLEADLLVLLLVEFDPFDLLFKEEFPLILEPFKDLLVLFELLAAEELLAFVSFNSYAVKFAYKTLDLLLLLLTKKSFKLLLFLSLEVEFVSLFLFTGIPFY